MLSMIPAPRLSCSPTCPRAFETRNHHQAHCSHCCCSCSAPNLLPTLSSSHALINQPSQVIYSHTVTLAPFMRDLLLIGDDLNGFDVRPQTHFFSYHCRACGLSLRVCQARYQLQMRKGGIVELAQLRRHISHDHMKLAKSPIASPSAVTKKRERDTQTVLTAL